MEKDTAKVFPSAGAQSDKAGLWGNVVSFLGMEIFGQDVYEWALRQKPGLAAPSEKEIPVDIRLEEWEWQLFRLQKGVRDYIKNNSAFMPGQKTQEFSRASSALADLFWAVVSLSRKELWGRNIGVRTRDNKLILVEIPDSQSSLPPIFGAILGRKPE
jgi:hypothetical protein